MCKKKSDQWGTLQLKGLLPMPWCQTPWDTPRKTEPKLIAKSDARLGSMNWTPSGTSQRCSIWLQFGQLGGKVKALSSLSHSSGHSLWCAKSRCPTAGGITIRVRGYTWSVAVYGRGCVKVASTWMPGSKVSQQNIWQCINISEMISIIHFICQRLVWGGNQVGTC